MTMMDGPAKRSNLAPSYTAARSTARSCRCPCGRTAGPSRWSVSRSPCWTRPPSGSGGTPATTSSCGGEPAQARPALVLRLRPDLPGYPTFTRDHDGPASVAERLPEIGRRGPHLPAGACWRRGAHLRCRSKPMTGGLGLRDGHQGVHMPRVVAGPAPCVLQRSSPAKIGCLEGGAVSAPRPGSRSSQWGPPAPEARSRGRQLAPLLLQPVLPQATVPRPRIVDQLLGWRRGRGCDGDRAGRFGKSTASGSGHQESAACVAWLQSSGSQGPGAATCRRDARPGGGGRARIGSARGTGRGRCELLAHVTEPVLLVLDDIDGLDALDVLHDLDGLDSLHGGASLDLVAEIVIGLPAGSHVALSRRVRPRGRIAGVRHDWRFAQFDASSLTFTREEGADLLGAAGVRLDPDSAVEVVTRTEGWAAGLHLAGAWLRDKDDVRRRWASCEVIWTRSFGTSTRWCSPRSRRTSSLSCYVLRCWTASPRPCATRPWARTGPVPGWRRSGL